MDRTPRRPRLAFGPEGPDDPGIRMPRGRLSPSAAIGRRLLLALGLLLFVAAVAWVTRGDYADNSNPDAPVGLLDVLYYASVSITTTGYGDIVPVTDSARLATVLLITPARILFLVLLVGTTLEVLTERTRERYRQRRWSGRVRDHFIVAGYGVKGRSAVRIMLAQGIPRERIVVIDNRPQAVEQANAAQLVAILGNAAASAVLESAGIRTAEGVIVAPQEDDAAVLITLTARQLNPNVTIVASAREQENAQLMRQSGADSVITSAESAGRLLGLATRAPRLVQVLEDLATIGTGLDIAERALESGEVGSVSRIRRDHLVIGVVREERFLPFDDPLAQSTRAGDRLIYLRSRSA